MGQNPDLVIRVAANVAALQSDMAEAVKTIKAIEGAIVPAAEASSGWEAILNNLGHSFVARVAEGVLLRDAVHEILHAVGDAIEAFPALVEHTIAVGDSLFEMAMKTGSSVEGLSSLRYVASQTGIDFNSFGTTISMLEKNLGATDKAGEKVSEALSGIGLDLDTVKAMRPDEAFIAVAHSLSEVENNADKAHVAALLMGKGAKEMAALWHEDITPMIHEAQDLGLVMSTETAAGAHLAEIGFKSLHMQMEAVGMHIANAFIPAIIGIEHDLGEGLTDAVKTLNSSLTALGSQGGPFSIVARAMGTGADAAKAQGELYDYLKGALIGVVRNGLEPMVTAVAYGMVGWNATEVVVGNVVQVINYLALGYEKALKAYETFKLVTTGDDIYKRQLEETQGVIDGLNKEIEARAKSIGADKKAEGEWVAWSAQAHAAIEVSLNAIAKAHTDVGEKVKEMADVSRASYGKVSEESEAAGYDVKKFAKAWEELNAKSSDFASVVAGLNPKLVEMATYYLKLGASVKTVAEAIPELGDANVLAIDKMRKAADEFAKQDAKIAEQMGKLWSEYYDLQAQLGGSALDKKLAHNEKWFNDEVAKIKDSDTDWMGHYALLEQMRAQKDANDRQAAQEADVTNKQSFVHKAAVAHQYYTDALADSGNYSTERLAQLKAEDVAAQANLQNWDKLSTKVKAVTGDVQTLTGAYISAKQAADEFAKGSTVDIGTAAAGDSDLREFLHMGWSLKNATQLSMARKWGFQAKTFSPLGDPETSPDPKERVPGYASGVEHAPGGWSMVGERGPEAMYVPQGASILPSGSGGGTTVTQIYITQPLGTPEALAKVIDDALIARERGRGTRF